MECLGDSKVTSKFQATVPKRVREFLNIGTDDRLLFVKDNDQIVLKRGELRVKQ